MNATAASLKAAYDTFSAIQSAGRIHVRTLAEQVGPTMSRNDFAFLVNSFIAQGSVKRTGDYLEFVGQSDPDLTLTEESADAWQGFEPPSNR